MSNAFAMTIRFCFSISVPIALGNYHNVTADGRIGAEYISLDDLAGLVALCREIALRTEPAGRTRVAELLKERLEKEIEEFRPYYARADV